MKKIIFTLAEARSGTLYLRNLFRLNARDCDCRHETFFDVGNPTMFGPAIYDAHAGRFGDIRARLEKKRRYIQKLSGSSYIESSHAFLKSSRVAALDFFPDLRLVHLIRDPFKVAASEAYRELWRRRLHVPFHFYRGDDGKRHFAWALTGNEAIFQHFTSQPLTLFQWYLIQWVEIENRAMNFLDANGLHDRCFTLHSPHDLNDAAKVRGMFDFLGVQTMGREIVFGGRKNKSIGYFMSPASTDNESQFVLERLPESYLHIFRKKPYSDLHWASRLNNRGNRSVNRPSEPENCSLPGRLSQLTC